jgi:hypothetical protein
MWPEIANLVVADTLETKEAPFARPMQRSPEYAKSNNT